MLQPSATDSASCDSLDAVIAALDAAGCTPRRSGTGYTSRCPAHADRNPSLSLTAGDRQPVILKCHAGCTYDEIVTALHLERPAPRSTPTRGAPEAVYDYTTYEVVRFSGKRFYQRRPDGKSGYHWNLRGVTPRLYHQDEIFLCVAIVEGEKDVDALRDHLVKHQRPWIGKDARFSTTATCNSGGAGNWTSVNTQRSWTTRWSRCSSSRTTTTRAGSTPTPLPRAARRRELPSRCSRSRRRIKT